MSKGIKRKLDIAYKNVQQTIKESIDHSNRFSSGLSGEGYNGGYRDALNDVLLALNGYTPNRHQWWEDKKEPST